MLSPWYCTVEEAAGDRRKHATRPLTVSDNAGTITWTHDELGNIATQTDVWGLVLTYTRDAANRVTQVADSKGGTKVYVWDDASRLTSVRYSDSGSQLRFDFTYNDRDQVTQIDRYTDTAGTTKVSLSQFTYDDAGRVTGITHKNGAGTTTLDSFNYQYDDAGRITQETSTLGPTKNYTFDDAGQVTGDGTATFAWDANGNRVNSGYVTSTGNRTTSDGTWTYTFDDEGNVIKKSMGTGAETWVYGYDNNNRLIHIEKRNTDAGAAVMSVDYVYDALGNRVKRDYDADGAGSGASVATKMAYDGQNEWADLDSSLTIQTRRVATQAIDAYFARVSTSGNEDWYLDDIIGSVRDIVDSTNSPLDHIDYSTFGDTPTETNSANGDRFKFTSKEYEFGIQHNFWRDLQNGRWMQEDPKGFGAGDANLHRYVENSPTSATDPLGLQYLNGRWVGAGPESRDEPPASYTPPRVAPTITYDEWNSSAFAPPERPLRPLPIGTGGSSAGLTRVLGGIRTAFGIVEIFVGLSGSLIGGGFVAAHGVDNAWAGIRTLWTGQEQQGFTENRIDAGLQALGVDPATSRMAAGFLDGMVSMGGQAAMRAGQQMTVVAVVRRPNTGVVAGVRNRGAFDGMTLTGRTGSGMSRISSEWRALYGPAAIRRHHLVPQELLRNPAFRERMRALGYGTPEEIAAFVNRQIADIPNVMHMRIHAEGWNEAWRAWLRRNPNFTVGDVRSQMASMMYEFEVPFSSLGGPMYGR